MVSLTYKSLNLLELLENLKTTSLRTAPLSVRFFPFRERTPYWCWHPTDHPRDRKVTRNDPDRRILPFSSSPSPFSDALQCVKYRWILYVIWNQYVVVFADRGNVRIVLFELPCRPDDDAVLENSQVRIQRWDAAFHERGHDPVVLGHVVVLPFREVIPSSAVLILWGRTGGDSIQAACVSIFVFVFGFWGFRRWLRSASRMS